MVSMTEFEYRQHEQRLAKVKEPAVTGGDERETGRGGLQEKIQQWLDAQWPRWLCIRARSDKRSTIGVGIHDYTIFGPYPICILVECKTKTGKRSEDQRNWAFEMQRLGWTVEIVRSLEDFQQIVANHKAKPICEPKKT